MLSWGSNEPSELFPNIEALWMNISPAGLGMQTVFLINHLICSNMCVNRS